MSRVLTNEQNYYDIADTIRQMKNVNTTYKPRQMASALKDIYSNEVEGVPPLTFQANGNNLLNYRIDGASGGVGDRTANLFDGSWENKFIATYGNIGYSTNRVLSSYVTVIPNQTYSVKSNMLIRAVHSYNGATHTQALIDNVAGLDGATFTIPADSNSIRISLKKANDGDFTPDDIDWCMLNIGSEALPNEPYGYKVPVVVNGKNLFDENSELNTNSTMDLTTGTFPGSTGDNKRTFFFKAKPNTTYTFSCDTIGDRLVICEYNRIINPSDYSTSHKITPNIKTFSQASGISEYSFTTSSTTKMVGIYYSLNTLPTSIQIEIGNIATDYEPYIEPTTTNIYLDEPIEENESISLSDTNKNIPTIDGTNTLTINTTIQPSNVYVQAPKDSIEATMIANALEEI